MALTGSRQARTALDDLIAALQAHLTACEQRTGEDDAAVGAAYATLRAAAERYDDALYDTFDEVTPWELADEPAQGGGPAEVAGRIAVLVRRDYQVVDAQRLVAAGRDADAEAGSEAGITGGDVPEPGLALHQMLYAYGVDGLDHRAEAAGLDPRGGTVWVQALPAGDDTMLDDPFGVADEELLVYRLDEVVEDVDGAEDLEGLMDAEERTDLR